jgi:hypothetical protein
MPNWLSSEEKLTDTRERIKMAEKMKIVTQSTIRTKGEFAMGYTELELNFLPIYTTDFFVLSQPETRAIVLDLLRKQAEAQTTNPILAAQAWHLHDSFWHYCYAR